MDDVTDNLAQAGTDSAPTPHDTSSDWDYYDPDEEKQDTVTPDVKQETEGETDEISDEAVQEAAKSGENEEQSEDEEAPQSDKPNMPRAVLDTDVVTLKDGKQMTIAEMRNGILRQDDYSRKTNRLSENAAQVERTVQAIGDFLGQSIPPEPDIRLSVSDPQRYLAEKVQHDAAVKQWQDIMQLAETPRGVNNQLNAEYHHEVLTRENELLVQALPKLKDETARTAFMQKAMEVMASAGVTREEAVGFTDHRYFRVLDLAIDGLAFRKSRDIAKQKVAAAPPITAPKRQQLAKNAGTDNRNAMRKLSLSGSIRDAMAVDFE